MFRTATLSGARAAYAATLVGALVAAAVLALAAAPALARERVAPGTAAPAPATAADMRLAALRSLRDMPGQEAIGIAHAIALLRQVDAGEVDAGPFDALGTMAERLARRASGIGPGAAATASIDAVAALGVRFVTWQHDDRRHWCYDGEAFRRVLALRPDAGQQARAMLALTRHDCIPPALTPAARIALDAWRADLLDLPWPRGYDELPAVMKNRLHLRRAGLWAARAHQRASLGRPAHRAAERALAELATVDGKEFNDEDRREYAEAAIRVGAIRWALVARQADAGLAEAGAFGLRLVVRAGAEPGRTCVQLLAAEGAPVAGSAGSVGSAGNAAKATGPAAAGPSTPAHDERGPRLLAQRCGSGTAWVRSVSVHPAGAALSLAVQPRDGWTELWVFRPDAAGAAPGAPGGWRVDVLAPTPAVPGLGAVEFAGWLPGAPPRMRIAQPARGDRALERRVDVLALETLPGRIDAPSVEMTAGLSR